MPFNINNHLIPFLKQIISIYQLIIYAIFFHQNFLIYKQLSQQNRDSNLIIIGFLIWYYVLITLMIIELIQIYNTDTRDPLLSLIQNQQQFQPENLVFCVMCNQLVLKTSYHCWRCSKCIDNLDHHCKYLNCCIANNNYLAFLRLLVIFIMYSTDYSFLILNIIGQNLTIQHQISLLLTFSQLFLVICLFVFHIYLNCVAKQRTYEFVQRFGGFRRQRMQYNKPAIQLIEQSYSHS